LQDLGFLKLPRESCQILRISTSPRMFEAISGMSMISQRLKIQKFRISKLLKIVILKKIKKKLV